MLRCMVPPSYPTKLRLYWCTTADHDEDWFIVAESEEAAKKRHEDEEGYDEGDAKVRFVCDIPDDVPAKPGWPSEEVIKACGGRFLRKGTARVVKLGGRLYKEGTLEHHLEQIGMRKPVKPEPPPPPKKKQH